MHSVGRAVVVPPGVVTQLSTWTPMRRIVAMGMALGDVADDDFHAMEEAGLTCHPSAAAAT